MQMKFETWKYICFWDKYLQEAPKTFKEIAIFEYENAKVFYARSHYTCTYIYLYVSVLSVWIKMFLGRLLAHNTCTCLFLSVFIWEVCPPPPPPFQITDNATELVLVFLSFCSFYFVTLINLSFSTGELHNGNRQSDYSNIDNMLICLSQRHRF